MSITQADAVSSPADVTTKLLSGILAHEVSSFELHPLGRGVMSNVQVLTVSYADSKTSDDGLPTRFVVKFKKPEIPLPDLFSVEGEFYRLTEPIFNSSSKLATDSFPFQLVKGIATGHSWLMLELIPQSDVKTFNVHEGCPSNLFDDLLIRLARMHAFFWIHGDQTSFTGASKSNFGALLEAHSDKLSTNPGAGHTLPIQMRQDQCLPAWPAVRERLALYLSSKHLQSIDTIVESTEMGSRIGKCATVLSERKCTLVHGDFHIGNILLPKDSMPCDECNKPSTPWLVDWSMAGVGNPLIDLVFFIVVGAACIPIHGNDTSSTSEHVKHILKTYHAALNDQRDTATVTTRLLLSWDEFLSMFRVCLLNQFIILICYDSLCRDMADAFPGEEGKVYHAHFDRVNVRCVRLLLSEFGWTENMFD